PQQQYPQIGQRLETLTHTLQGRHSDQEAIQLQLDNVVKQLEQCPDATNNIQSLELQMQQRRRQLDEQLSQQGRLQQRFTHLETLQTQYDEQQKQLQEFQRQYRVHQELALAFGKNGIQALMIENILPQLEAETNH